MAKNYLNESELTILNRMVTAYLEVAEIQAMNRFPMYMKDWIERLNDFLTMTGKNMLMHRPNWRKLIREGMLRYSMKISIIKSRLHLLSFIWETDKASRNILLYKS